VGHTLRVKVTAKNTVGEASASSVQTGTVAASAPANTVLPTISGEAKDEKTLTASAGTWTGSPTITYGYQWEACNTAGESCAAISGATGSTYTIAHAQVGDTIKVKETAKNSAGEASASSVATATVAVSVPANTVLPAISGEAKDEKTLTASTGAWTGTPTITYSYQWELCNSKGESCSNISGATSATFAVGHGDVGSTLRVVVTATNSGGSTSKGSEASVVVVPSPPASTVLPAIAGTAKEGQRLSATPGTWSGSEPVEYTDYVWQRCKAGSCQPISGASGATDTSYVLAAGDIGSTIEVTVTAKNSAGEASATSQPTSEVTAVAPQNTVPPAIVGEAQSGQTLTASTGTWSGTTPLTYSYLWEECNSHGQECQGIASAMSNGYTLSSSNIGHTIRVTVTAENVAGGATSRTATTGTVLEAGCTDGWTGPSEGAWGTPGNWSTGNVPGPADTACIPAGATVHVREGTNETGVLRSEGEVVISGGTLKLANSAKASELTSLTQSSGTIAGATLEISQALSWTGGTMEGPGPTILGPAAVSSVSNVILAGRELINEGTLTLAEHIWSGYPLPGTLTNKGTLQKPEGSAPAIIAVGFANEGTVNIRAGTLELESGGLPTRHPGVWSAANGAEILFRGGEYNLGSTATVSGAITITDGVRMAVQQINGADAQLSVAANGNYSYRPTVLDIEGPATSTIGTLNVNGAIGWESIATAALTGSGQVDVTKAFTGGTFAYLEGAGSTMIEPGASATVSSWLAIQEEHKLENAGTLTISEGARINGSSTGALINTGTLQKPEGTGTATIWAPIDNEGTVSVTAGALELTGGGSSGEHHADSWAAAEGAKIIFNNQDFALGSSVALAGTVEVSQGTVTAGTVEGPAAAVTLNGSQWERRGTLEVNGETPSTLGTLTLNGGGVAGAGKLSVTSAFLSEDGALLSGTGALELQASATGTISDVTLEERTLENAGALTIGASGTIDASKTARLTNSGTLTMNAEGLGSNHGVLATGYNATLVNTGVIQRTEGAGPGLISFAIENDGTINAEAGTLEFTGGGESAEFASDTWTAAPGASIELNGGTYGPAYSLGANATITGSMHFDSNVTAGAIKGPTASLTTLHTILTLTSLTTPSEIGSLTLLQAPPDVWYPQIQQLAVTGELDILNTLTWASQVAVTKGPGAIVTKPGSTTVFNAGSAHFDGGQFINEGTATWEAGQLGAEVDEGTFFINRGTFHANAQEWEPLMRGCVGLPSGGHQCPVFENDGIFTADLPRQTSELEPIWPHIAWEVDIVNYGDLEVPYTEQKECPPLPPYGWSSEQCVAELQKQLETYEGLLLKGGAEVIGPVWYVNPPTIEGFAEEGETLKVTPVIWRAPHITSISYQWQRCEAEEGTTTEEEWLTEPPPRECSDIPSASGSTYVVRAADVGYRLRAVVSAHTNVRSEAVDSEATNAVWPFELFGEEGEEEAAEESIEGEGEGSTVEEFVPEEGNRGAVMLAMPALTPAFAPESLAGDLYEPVGYIHYTPAHPRYNKIAYDDETGFPDGEWNNEARFTPKSTPAELSWLFNLSPRVQLQAIGTVSEKGTVYKLPSKKIFNYSDFHPGVLPNYNFHSRIHVYLGQEYQLELKFEYPCVKDEEEGLCIQYSKHNFKLDK
jgi:hypothetical protein